MSRAGEGSVDKMLPLPVGGPELVARAHVLKTKARHGGLPVSPGQGRQRQDKSKAPCLPA